MRVPEGWEYINLEDLGGNGRPAIKAGPFGSSLKKEFYVSSGYKIYGQEQVIANDPFIGNYYIDEEKYLSLKSCSVVPGDVLISLVGTVGKVLVIPKNAEAGIINPRLLRISLNHKKVSFYFFKYFLEDIKTKNKLESWAQGGTMGVLNAEILRQLPIPVPPLPEQKKIAQILSTWDKAIEKLHTLITAKQKRKKALMQQLFTGKMRFAGFEGEWKVGYLGDICIFKGGSAFKEIYQGEKCGDVPFIKVSDMNLSSNAVFINESNNWISYKVLREIKAKPFPKGTVVFAKVGAALLLNRRRILLRDTVIDNNMMAAIPKFCDKHFLYQLMLEIDFRKFVQDGAVPSVNQSDLSRFKISLPNLEEQQKIASVLSAADKEIETHQKELSALKQQKKGLMQQLLTGKKRVKIDEPVQQAAVGA